MMTRLMVVERMMTRMAATASGFMVGRGRGDSGGVGPRMEGGTGGASSFPLFLFVFWVALVWSCDEGLVKDGDVVVKGSGSGGSQWRGGDCVCGF
ncbi:hypothetical protein RJT34_05469 [Clitoria ternatea]|uniref:Uncharacterized protein n=1 Tax=Clitoria ternatea TaxID=43366 RepID=A0AAN9K336_CLITE